MNDFETLKAMFVKANINPNAETFRGVDGEISGYGITVCTDDHQAFFTFRVDGDLKELQTYPAGDY